MATAAPEGERATALTPPHATEHSRPPSSAGSTIDDPDMTDDETRIENEPPRPQLRDASSPAAATSTAGGSPRSDMKETTFNSHSFGTPDQTAEKQPRSSSSKKPKSSKEDDETVKTEKQAKRETDPDSKSAAAGAATVVGTRRQANGTIGSVYSGNKIRHLKKDDGVPLWRKDIQYEFLRTVFDDEQPVFTRISDGQKGCFFADIYIDAMARSSKTSKILKDKLQQDRAAAKNMAMICLLVNVGRMNTTLNFFPEMRAQLRTYHSIPSLQARADASAYKQLQDAPRLKSILKGASEDTEEPRTIEAIKEHSIPRTNPVNLIFVLSHYAPKISEMHFFPPQDFFDLVMRHTISSTSRARAFLWLMWWYLESDFSKEAAVNNPYGPGIYGDSNDPIPLKVPEFKHLSEEEGDLENVDTSEEIEFGSQKQNERKRILEEDDPTQDKVIKRLKKSAGDAGTDYESSPALKGINPDDLSRIPSQRLSTVPDPSKSTLEGIANSLDDDWEPVDPHPGRGRYKRPTKKDKEARDIPRTSLSGRTLNRKGQGDRDTPSEAAATPQPPGSSAHPVLHQYTGGPERGNTPAAPGPSTSSRRPRPLTQHQIAVEAHRRARVEYILSLKKREVFDSLELRRESQDWFARATKRIERLPTGYDSEDEEQSWGMGGLVPNPDSEEEEDYGEEAEMWIRVVRRVQRRLARWGGDAEATSGKRARRSANIEASASPAVHTPSVRKASSKSRRKAPLLAAPARVNGDIASSQAGGYSDDQGADEDGNDADIDGEDVTMLLEEELGRPSKVEDEGLDDIDRDLLAEGESDEEEIADAESDGAGSDVEMAED